MSNPRVLVVDDDDAVRLTLGGIIEEEGFEVRCAEDGYRAIALAKSQPFALVFMDIRMPGMNGVEAFKEIRRLNPESTVVMMTAFAPEELVAEAQAQGAYAVVDKPFDPEHLVSLLGLLIQGRI